MNKKYLPSIFAMAAATFAAILPSGGAYATATVGGELDAHCARQPVGTAIPQQSRPYRASGNSCALCHPGGNTNQFNTLGTATRSCTSTSCPTSVNSACVNTAPTNPAISAPANGTNVTQGTAVTFTGSATDPDNFPTTMIYTWSFTGGLPAVTGQSVSVPMTAAGTITATLEVRDAIGTVAATRPTRSVTVTAAPPPNQAPNGSITAPVSVVQGQAVTFTGSGTDPDNNLPLTYAWTFGANATPATSTSQNPSVTFSTTGNHNVTLTVTDSRGLADPQQASVTVNVTAPANQAPNGTITVPANIVQGVAANFQGSATDPNGDTVTYLWNFGANATPATSTAQNPSVTFGTVGPRDVTLTVTDSRGLADPTPATANVSVAAPPPTNQAPAGTITAPTSIVQGTPVTFQGSATDPNGDTVTYAWSFGPSATPATSTAQNPTVTFSTAGTRTVTLTVTDSRGLADPTPASVTVSVAASAPVNNPPNGTITPPASIVQGQAASFLGSATDPNGDAVTYAWTFGVGATPETSTAQNPSVTFSSTGSRTVNLTVTDSKGLADPTPATAAVTVAAPPAACTDADNDGFFVQGGSCGPQDCNDANAAINPGAAERCGDGIDNDCDKLVDTADKECNGTDCLARFFARPVVITQASWGPDDGINQLKVEGNQADPGAAVTVFNAATGALLGTTTADSAGTEIGQWEFETNTNTPPCRVRVDINGQRAERSVSNAPANCVGGPAPPPVNAAPNGTITPPATIVQGQVVTFQGSATDANGDAVTYAWAFGANATPATSTAQNPSVTFAAAGSRTVTLRVTDSRGLADPTPASVTVNVTAPAPTNAAPNGTITPPATIVQGQAVTFRGSATDANGDAVTWAWNFGAAATPATSTAQNPSVTFATAGSRDVTLTVTDSRGLADPTPARVTVAVAAANRPPESTILSPTSNVTIERGHSVSFRGTGSDPDGNTPLTYSWNFGGGATNSTLQNPRVRFSRNGIYTVHLTVRDSRGLADPTPATITVRVVEDD